MSLIVVPSQNGKKKKRRRSLRKETTRKTPFPFFFPLLLVPLSASRDAIPSCIIFNLELETFND